MTRSSVDDPGLRRRPVFAAVASSAAIVCAISWSSCAYLVVVAGAERATLAAIGLTTLYFFLFGWPIAIVATLLGVPAYRALQEKYGCVRCAAVILPPTLLGSIVFSVAWDLFQNSVRGIALTAALGAIGGFAGGACFWLIARRGPQQAVAAE